MKKLLLLLLAAALLCTACAKEEKEEPISDETTEEESSVLDDTSYALADIELEDIQGEWIEDGTNYDLTFTTDWEFYYIDESEPVDDSDLYETYRYDKEKRQIIAYSKLYPEFGTLIFTLVEYKGDTMKLELNGKVLSYTIGESNTTAR